MVLKIPPVPTIFDNSEALTSQQFAGYQEDTVAPGSDEGYSLYGGSATSLEGITLPPGNIRNLRVNLGTNGVYGYYLEENYPVLISLQKDGSDTALTVGYTEKIQAAYDVDDFSPNWSSTNASRFTSGNDIWGAGWSNQYSGAFNGYSNGGAGGAWYMYKTLGTTWGAGNYYISLKCKNYNYYGRTLPTSIKIRMGQNHSNYYEYDLKQFFSTDGTGNPISSIAYLKTSEYDSTVGSPTTSITYFEIYVDTTATGTSDSLRFYDLKFTYGMSGETGRKENYQDAVELNGTEKIRIYIKAGELGSAVSGASWSLDYFENQ